MRSIHGSHDLPRGWWAKCQDFLFGRSPDLMLSKPYGITHDGLSTLYIADTGRKCVVVLSLDSGEYRTIRSLGPYGELLEPVNVLLDGDKNLYVADTRLGRIAVFDAEDRFDRFIGAKGQMVSPVGMAIEESLSTLYAVDTRRHEVFRFTLEGDFLGSFGERGDQQGEFYHPLGIAISPRDTVYIVDSFHFAVQAVDLSGDYLYSFGQGKRGVGTMARPRSIAIDAEGHLYVTDALRHNIQVYDQGGQLMMDFGTPGAGEGQFRLPAGICITAEDRIYVADSINNRIQEFTCLGSNGLGW